MRKISPLNDVVFKKVMGEKGDELQLKAFIEAVLGRKFKSIEIVGAVEITPENVGNRLLRLDVVAIADDGTSINVEVQLKNKHNMDKRSLLHWRNLFGHNFKAGKDSDFANLTDVVTINILGFDFFPEEKNFHNVYHIKNDESGNILTKSLEMHFIEMPKFHKLETKNTKNNALHRLLLYFDNRTNEKNLKELEAMDMAIQQAAKQYDYVISDDDTLRLIKIREEGELDYYSELNEVRAEGKAEGMAQGKHEQSIETAKILLQSGIDVKIIATSTGLTEEEIANIK